MDGGDNMVKHVLANCDIAMAATAVSTYLSKDMIIDHEVSEEGFLWSNRWKYAPAVNM
jgi:hypothetical protein